MSIQFDFSTAGRILFGAGKISEVGKLAAEQGRKALVVYGKNRQRVQPLLAQLSAGGVEVILFSVSGEPTVDVVRIGVDLARRENCDLVIGFGGGSALDAGKAIAVLTTNEGDVLDYLEVIGRGKTLSQPPIPYFAIPTTAGTGTEVTRNAVIGSPEHKVKVSLRHITMLPRLALVDPELTYSLGAEETASTGLDALTQLIEPFVSNLPNPMTDALCREGMRRSARSLLRAYQHGEDLAAREDLCVASLFSGMTLANARLGAVHGFAGVLGGATGAPHGAICASLLPFVMAENVRVLQEREPENPALDRYVEAARILTGKETATAQAGIAWVQEICDSLNIPSLRSVGLKREEFSIVVEKSMKASSMKGNPIQLKENELEEILEKAF